MADVLVRDEGSVIMLTPKSEKAKAWVDENLGLESWQWLGPSFAVEWRYAPDIVQGMMGDGLDVIPECHEVTDDDKKWLSELGITASKKAAAPVAQAAPAAEEATPQQAVTPAVKGLGGVAIALPAESEEKEKHTVLPELPNSRYHMADNRDVAAYWDSASFDTRQEIVRSSILRSVHPVHEMVGKGPKQFTDEEAYEIAGTPWKQLTIGIKMELIAIVQNYMGYGTEDLGDTVPEFDDQTKAELSSMGIIAKMARGGWKRISMSTVQSDDDRFTITIIDATRRKKWFLLKDLESGESYEERTMTDAKKKALSIRGDDSQQEEIDPHEDEEEPSTHSDNYADHQYCETCGECTTCNLRPCTAEGGEHKVSTSQIPNRTAKLAVEETMATPIQGTKTSKDEMNVCKGCGAKRGIVTGTGGLCSSCRDKETKKSSWARLRQVAAEEPKEADAAIAELAEALGTMADSLNNLRTNLDLVEAPKTASIKVRVQAARKYAAKFRQIAEEAPEVMADALSEVYHSLDEVAGAVETLAENMGIELSLTPAEAAFGEEGKEELGGEWGPEEPESGAEPKVVDEPKFEEAEKELESPKAAPAEEKLDEEIGKEAGSIEFVTDRDEQGDPQAPVLAAKKKKELPDFLKKKKDEKDGKDEKKEKKADGSAAFVSDHDNNAKPEAPAKTEAPEAQGETEVGKAAAIAARREQTRQRIAKRHGIQL
jgi:hypothetical protein